MNEPIISWHIKDGDNMMEYEDFYGGSFSSSDTIKLNIQVWNNRGGISDSKDIDNAHLIISFEKVEDNIISKFMKVNVDDKGFNDPETSLDRAEVELGLLSGYKNDGIANTKNKDNYRNIAIVIEGLPTNLKGGLRNMLFNIEGN